MRRKCQVVILLYSGELCISGVELELRNASTRCARTASRCSCVFTLRTSEYVHVIMCVTVCVCVCVCVCVHVLV